jgi:hypothetical protein
MVPTPAEKKAKIQHRSTLKNEMREEHDQRQITESHQLGAVSFPGQANGIGTEHECYCSQQRGDMAELPRPRKHEHEHARQKVEDHHPGPGSTEIQYVDGSRDDGLDVVDIMRDIRHISKRRHPAEEVWHPENVDFLSLLDHFACVSIA